MKRDGQPKQLKRVKIRWDEGNLSENERIKAELDPVRIEEPKTPYHSPPRDEEDFDDLVEGGGWDLGTYTSKGGDPVEAGVEIDDDRTLRGAGTASSDLGCKVTTTEAKKFMQDLTTAIEEKHHTVGIDAAKEAFDARRRSHYNMADALKSKETLDKDDDDDVIAQNCDAYKGTTK